MAKKLTNAPLEEVIFELRWNVPNSEELSRFNYLHGDLYSRVKHELSYRESIPPPEMPLELSINRPVYRFRPNKDKYPLVQIGPGIFTTNTIDQDYYWAKFQKFTNERLKNFYEVYKFSSESILSLSLQYHDFIVFDFEESNVLEYLSRNLHIALNQDFYKAQSNPRELSLGFSYNTSFGKFIIKIGKGRNQNNKEGIIILFKVVKDDFGTNQKEISEWINNAHNLCSETFLNMTKGKLYELFK